MSADQPVGSSSSTFITPLNNMASDLVAGSSPSGSSQAAGPSMVRGPRRWTAEEDAQLLSAVSVHGSQRGPGNKWSLVSAGLPGRTNKDCRKRWFYSLDPNLLKGKWSQEEDEALRRLYGELGPQWKEIALGIPGRNDDQVSNRWRDALAPGLTTKQPWTSAEDALLLSLLKQKGPKWTAIADHLPGRSAIACRNRSRKYATQSSCTRFLQVGTKPDSASDESMPKPDGSASDESMPTPLPQSEPEWHLPLASPFPQLAFNYDTPFLPCSDVTVHNMLDPNLVPPIDPGSLLNDWLASLSSGAPSPLEPAPAPTDTDARARDPSPPEAPVFSQGSSLDDQPPYGSADVPADNTWSLLLALNSGQQSVTVDAAFMRQLLSAATRGAA